MVSCGVAPALLTVAVALDAATIVYVVGPDIEAIGYGPANIKPPMIIGVWMYIVSKSVILEILLSTIVTTFEVSYGRKIYGNI